MDVQIIQKHPQQQNWRAYCRYSMSAIWAFDHIENKHTLYIRKDCMEKFSSSLREQTKNIIDFGKKKCYR